MFSKFWKKFLLVITLLSIIFILFFIFSLRLHENKKTVLILKIDDVITYDNLDIDSIVKTINSSKYDGLIFYINSPGGDISILKILYYLDKINSSIPIVCYIDHQATSAAYWLCSKSDYIISSPDSLVGNIGAYAIFIDSSKLLEKIGINITIIESTPHKTIGNVYYPLDDEEYKFIQETLDNITKMFIDDIKSKRNIHNEKLAFSGLPFYSFQAINIGLIDEIGDINSAKRKISELLNVSEDKINFIEVNFKVKKGILEKLLLFNSLFEGFNNYIYKKRLYELKIVI